MFCFHNHTTVINVSTAKSQIPTLLWMCYLLKLSQLKLHQSWLFRGGKTVIHSHIQYRNQLTDSADRHSVEMLTEKRILDPETQDEGVEEVAHPDLEYQILGDKLELRMHLGVKLSSINKQTEDSSDESSEEAS